MDQLRCSRFFSQRAIRAFFSSEEYGFGSMTQPLPVPVKDFISCGNTRPVSRPFGTLVSPGADPENEGTTECPEEISVKLYRVLPLGYT